MFESDPRARIELIVESTKRVLSLQDAHDCDDHIRKILTAFPLRCFDASTFLGKLAASRAELFKTLSCSEIQDFILREIVKQEETFDGVFKAKHNR